MGDLRSFFAAGKAAPIGNTRYPSGYGLTQRRHRPFRPTRRSALGLFHPDRRLSGSGPFRHARHAPRLNRKIRLARKIRRPGTSFARKIRQPDSRSISLPPARPSFHPAPVLSAFFPLRSPSPARFTPLPPRRNTCRASPLPPNGMPHEPRRGRPVQICRPDRMPRQKERQPAGAAALRQSDSGPIICC